ncbi:Phage head completion protein (GPL) [compost metagenome]
MPLIAPAPSPTGLSPAAVTNDGWWPDFDLNTARNTMRLDGTVTDARLRHVLAAGMLEVNMDAPVLAWRASREAAGATRLEEVTAPQVDGISRLVYLYRRAVYSFATADLIERYVDYDTAASGIKRAELQTSAPDEHRRNGRWAARQLVGAGRSTVELI